MPFLIHKIVLRCLQLQIIFLILADKSASAVYIAVKAAESLVSAIGVSLYYQELYLIFFCLINGYHIQESHQK